MHSLHNRGATQAQFSASDFGMLATWSTSRMNTKKRRRLITICFVTALSLVFVLILWACGSGGGPSSSLPSSGGPSIADPSSSGPTPPPQAAGYSLAFSDDFSTLNLSSNGLGSYNWYNPGIYWESAAPYSSITDTNSVLTLTWNQGQTPPGDTSISTAAVDGSQYRAWRYGYFEVSMK